MTDNKARLALHYSHKGKKPRYSVKAIHISTTETRYVVCAQKKDEVLYACNEHPALADWSPSILAAKKFNTMLQARAVINVCIRD